MSYVPGVLATLANSKYEPISVVLPADATCAITIESVHECICPIILHECGHLFDAASLIRHANFNPDTVLTQRAITPDTAYPRTLATPFACPVCARTVEIARALPVAHAGDAILGSWPTDAGTIPPQLAVPTDAIRAEYPSRPRPAQAALVRGRVFSSLTIPLARAAHAPGLVLLAQHPGSPVVLPAATAATWVAGRGDAPPPARIPAQHPAARYNSSLSTEPGEVAALIQSRIAAVELAHRQAESESRAALQAAAAVRASVSASVAAAPGRAGGATQPSSQPTRTSWASRAASGMPVPAPKPVQLDEDAAQEVQAWMDEAAQASAWAGAYSVLLVLLRVWESRLLAASAAGPPSAIDMPPIASTADAPADWSCLSKWRLFYQAADASSFALHPHCTKELASKLGGWHALPAHLPALRMSCAEVGLLDETAKSRVSWLKTTQQGAALALGFVDTRSVTSSVAGTADPAAHASVMARVRWSRSKLAEAAAGAAKAAQGAARQNARLSRTALYEKYNGGVVPRGAHVGLLAPGDGLSAPPRQRDFTARLPARDSDPSPALAPQVADDELERTLSELRVAKKPAKGKKKRSTPRPQAKVSAEAVAAAATTSASRGAWGASAPPKLSGSGGDFPSLRRS